MDVFLLEMVVESVQTNKISIAAMVNVGFLECKVGSDGHTHSYESVYHDIFLLFTPQSVVQLQL